MRMVKQQYFKKKKSSNILIKNTAKIQCTLAANLCSFSFKSQ